MSKRHQRKKSQRTGAAEGAPQVEPPSAPAAPTEARLGSPKHYRVAIIICAIVALVLLALVWAVPRALGDLYMSLASGRDIVEGRVAQPDTWSFATEGRVWFNQNWLTHLALYACDAAMGRTGWLVFKAALVLTLGAAVTLASRQCGTAWPVALLGAGAIALAAKGYIDPRPNLVTLAFTPLLLGLLLRTRKKRAAIWWTVPLLGLWANSHGGFLFGLGMMGLWAGAQTVAAWSAKRRIESALKATWPLWAATGAAIALAAFANPYGTRNLTHAFVITDADEVWQIVKEWRPILEGWDGRLETLWGVIVTGGGVGFGSLWEFFVLGGLLLGLLVVRAATWWFARGGAGRRLDAQQWTTLGFHALLACVAVGMAFKSRRFIPLAMLVMAPYLASLLSWALAARRTVVPTLVLAAALLVPAAGLARIEAVHYSPDNPLVPSESFPERMVNRALSFPVGIDAFLNRNQIADRVLNEWRWEGYLRWHCPQMKLWVGGRAQQVYDAQTFIDWMKLHTSLPQDGPLPEASKPWADYIRGHDVPLVTGPFLSGRTRPLMLTLTEAADAHWAFIYFDGRNAMVADVTHPGTRGLVEALIAGRLEYPDARTAALSRARCLLSPAVLRDPELKADPKLAMTLLREAIADWPHPMAYQALWQHRRFHPGGTRQMVAWLESEYARLEAMDPFQARGMWIMWSRNLIAKLMANLFAAPGVNQPERAAMWEQRADDAQATLDEMKRMRL